MTNYSLNDRIIHLNYYYKKYTVQDKGSHGKM